MSLREPSRRLLFHLINIGGRDRSTAVLCSSFRRLGNLRRNNALRIQEVRFEGNPPCFPGRLLEPTRRSTLGSVQDRRPQCRTGTLGVKNCGFPPQPVVFVTQCHAVPSGREHHTPTDNPLARQPSDDDMLRVGVG